MRILYFSRDYTPHDHRFLTALASTEYQTYYLRLERRGHILEERSLPSEIEIVPWKGGQKPVSLRDGLSLWLDLRKVIHKIKPDLIQAGPVQRSAFLAALTGFHPLVTMSWGYDLLIDAQINAWWHWATSYTLRHSDLLIGDCDTIRQRAITYGMPKERIVTFPWGIDLDHFKPRKYDAEREKARDPQIFTLLSTRSWEPIYGVEVIARSFALAAQEYPNLRLIMLGNGSQASLLRGIFTQAGVEQHVYFPGQVGQDDLPRYFQQADLYISASHSDGTSISLLEAMACGKPVLVSDIPGNLEWVTPEVNGWVFPDGNIKALTDRILHAIRQKDRLEEMGLNARTLVEQRADWKQNFQTLLSSYEKLRIAKP